MSTGHGGAVNPLGSAWKRTRGWIELPLLLLAMAGLLVAFVVMTNDVGAVFGRGATRQARTDGRPVLVTADHALATPAGGRDGCMLRPGSILRLGDDIQGSSSMGVAVSSASDAPAPGDCRTGDAGQVDVDTLSGWKVLKAR